MAETEGGGGGGGTEGGAVGGSGLAGVVAVTLPDTAVPVPADTILVAGDRAVAAGFTFIGVDMSSSAFTLILSCTLNSFCVAAATFVTALHDAVKALTDCIILS